MPHYDPHPRTQGADANMHASAQMPSVKQTNMHMSNAFGQELSKPKIAVCPLIACSTSHTHSFSWQGVNSSGIRNSPASYKHNEFNAQIICT
jgi:hypothetical protein